MKKWTWLGVVVVLSGATFLFYDHAGAPAPKRVGVPPSGSSSKSGVVRPALGGQRLSLPAPRLLSPSTQPDAAPESPALADGEAVPEEPTAAEESPEDLVRPIIESGADASAWTREASRVFSDIRRELPRDLGHLLEFKKVECYLKGCVMSVVYPSSEAFEASAGEFWSNARLSQWTGPRGRTRTAALPDGKVLVSWLLMPDASSGLPN